jgi:hypothetical protein
MRTAKSASAKFLATSKSTVVLYQTMGFVVFKHIEESVNTGTLHAIGLQ